MITRLLDAAPEPIGQSESAGAEAKSRCASPWSFVARSLLISTQGEPMTRGWKIATGAVALAVLGGVWAALVARHSRQGPITLMGAVIRQDADTGQESPIADVGINAANSLAAASTQSDFSGFFRLPLRPEVRRGRAITLQFRHPGYQPLDLH